MAVESFLPSGTEPKLTVEKPVKEKPSVRELTTIESPGKPVPADEAETEEYGNNKESSDKKPLKKSRKKRAPVEIKQPKDAILIITEKPQAALKIASALGNPRKYSENNVPFYEVMRDGKKIIVASAVGHLFNLTYGKDQVGWPIFKMEWQPSHIKKAYMKNYYNLLSKLKNRAKEFVVASVDYHERTPVLENGKFKILKIGEMVDNIKKGKKSEEEYLIPSFNAKGVLKWKNLKKAISHDISEDLYEISLEYGRKVKLTSSHNIFKLKDKKIDLVKTTDLKIGESILCPAFLPTPNNRMPKISLLDLAKSKKSRKIYLAGRDIAKILQERIINKKRNNSHLNEKRIVLTQEGQEKIKLARLESGYSTKKIASMSDISQPSISMWENGLKNPTENNFTKYLSLLKMEQNFIENPAYCQVKESSFINVLKNNYLKQYNGLSNLDRATIPLNELSEEEINGIKDAIIYGSKNRRGALPVNLDITKELVRLIGYYLAEGDINNDYRMRFSLGLQGYGHEDKIIEEIKEFCYLYNLQPHFYLHNKIKHQIVTIDNSVLSLFFKNLLQFGEDSREKTIPSLIFHLDNELKLECLRGLFLGDGSLSERSIVFNTASEKLALDTSYLLLQLGVLASISKSVHKTSKGGEIMWRVTISNSDDLEKCKHIWKDHHRARIIKISKRNRKLKEKYGDLTPLKIKNIRKVDSSVKKIYDLSVEGENFIAGIGGICCHNTDYDLEGEVIGWNVLRFIMKKNDAKRMKFSTLTKHELEKSFDNLLPTLDWGNAYAGETRHYIDWLYGINLSRALMSAIKKTGSFKILSIGRVQGPALKIIVDREKEILSFKSEPYWNVLALANGIEFWHPKDIFKKEELDEFKDIKEAQASTIEKREDVEPPHPFDLTTLQREAYNLHKISPSNTLKIAQSLYLDGLISYPRTSSQKIPGSINPKSILKELEKQFPEVKKATRDNPVEGQKSDPAHPSIYPTGEFADLNDDEKKIYELIAKRFISAFMSDAKVERKNITLLAGDKKFTASGLKIIDKGWSQCYPYEFEERFLPNLNGLVKVDDIKFENRETQAPKRYTPASLITLLEKKSLGTKTTRSMIIDTLFTRGYLEGTSIKATSLGLKLIESLERYSPIIIDENLTRDLEDRMEEIQLKNENHLEMEKRVVESVEKLITDISKEFKLKEFDIGNALKESIVEAREMQKENSIIMPCPICNKGSLAIRYSKKNRRYFAACDRYPECKTTYSLPPNALIKTTGKTSQDGMPILVAIRKGRSPWEFPFNINYRKDNDSQNQLKDSQGDNK